MALALLQEMDENIVFSSSQMNPSKTNAALLPLPYDIMVSLLDNLLQAGEFDQAALLRDKYQLDYHIHYHHQDVGVCAVRGSDFSSINRLYGKEKGQRLDKEMGALGNTSHTMIPYTKSYNEVASTLRKLPSMLGGSKTVMEKEEEEMHSSSNSSNSGRGLTSTIFDLPAADGAVALSRMDCWSRALVLWSIVQDEQHDWGSSHPGDAVIGIHDENDRYPVSDRKTDTISIDGMDDAQGEKKKKKNNMQDENIVGNPETTRNTLHTDTRSYVSPPFSSMYRFQHRDYEAAIALASMVGPSVHTPTSFLSSTEYPNRSSNETTMISIKDSKNGCDTVPYPTELRGASLITAFLQHLERDGQELTVWLRNAAIDAYARFGAVDKACQLVSNEHIHGNAFEPKKKNGMGINRRESTRHEKNRIGDRNIHDPYEYDFDIDNSEVEEGEDGSHKLNVMDGWNNTSDEAKETKITMGTLTSLLNAFSQKRERPPSWLLYDSDNDSIETSHMTKEYFSPLNSHNISSASVYDRQWLEVSKETILYFHHIALNYDSLHRRYR